MRHPLLNVPVESSRYLFTSLGAVTRCDLHTEMRPRIVLLASGIALVAGLLLIYLPFLRHPAVLLLAAIALGGAVAWYPEPALLAGQAGSLGIALSLLAALLQRGVLQRRRPVVAHDLSSSILQRSAASSPPGTPPVSDAPTQITAAAPAPAPSSHR